MNPDEPGTADCQGKGWRVFIGACRPSARRHVPVIPDSTADSGRRRRSPGVGASTTLAPEEHPSPTKRRADRPGTRPTRRLSALVSARSGLPRICPDSNAGRRDDRSTRRLAGPPRRGCRHPASEQTRRSRPGASNRLARRRRGQPCVRTDTAVKSATQGRSISPSRSNR